MTSNSGTKWQFRAAVLGIFLTGVIAGLLAMNIYRTRQWSPSGGGMHSRFEEVIEKLDLTDEQRTQVTETFEEARTKLNELRNESEPKFREVRRQTDEKLQSVLTPQQWEQFQQMMKESRRNHPRGGRSRRGGE